MATEMICSDVEALAERIPDGAKIALFKDCGVPMALGLALIRRGTSALHLVTVPTGNLLPDMLIGAGCVATVETSGISLGEFGPAPRFIDAVKRGAVSLLDATCPAIYTGLQAAEKGIPFMPMRGLIGSDLLRARPDFKVIDNPCTTGDIPDPIVAIPAIKPDFAVFHAPLADHWGNVYVARQAEFKMMAHAARDTLVTVEKVVSFNLLEDERYAPATLNGFYVGGVAEAPRGAWPLNLPGHYALERQQISDYARAARDENGFRAWLAALDSNARDAA